jgi:hypothetical protein
MSYQPIENYGIIGNMRTVALVGMNGSIYWYCGPRFDSPSIFGAILDYKKGGRFQISAESDSVRRKQFYWPSTNRLGYALPVGGWNRRARRLHASGFTLRLAWAPSYLSPYTLCLGGWAHFGLLLSGLRLWTTDP